VNLPARTERSSMLYYLEWALWTHSIWRRNRAFLKS